jgi:uncharacterized protein with PQ loop repeat
MIHGFHNFHLTKHGREAADRRIIFDKFMYLVGLFAPLMTVPQILKIWYYQDADGVSWLSWGGYMIGSLFWFIYGILHKEKPLIICNGVAALLQLFVVVGTVLFS